MAIQDTMNTITITHVTTATTIIDINGIKFLTDPVLGPPSNHDMSHAMSKMPKEAQTYETPTGKAPHISNFDGPALEIDELPPIDAVLLSHEDHPDNLDPTGRRLLDARQVFTNTDAAKKLSPRPGVVGLKPYDTVEAVIGGTKFKITGTPCRHVPGGECTGFILETESFGHHASGRPNAIWISGDTIDFDELVEIGTRWHIQVAQVHLGAAKAPTPVGPTMICLDGKSAIDLVRHFDADVMVPVHMDGWSHFTEHSAQVWEIVKQENFEERTCFLTAGRPKVVRQF
jgi:L-ascorbate metabolism protein UlaG (beta-lactamase superfamily)